MSNNNVPPGFDSGEGDGPKPRYQPPGGFGTAAGQPVSPLSNPDPTPAPGPLERPADWPSPGHSDPANAWGGSSFGQGIYGSYSTGAAVPPNASSRPAGPNNYYAYPPAGSPGLPVPLDPQAEAYRLAAKRVNARLDFYKHLTSYVIVNVFLWSIALLSGSLFRGGFWPIWITVFWGIGLASQAWQVFGSFEHRQQQMIEEEMRRMRK